MEEVSFLEPGHLGFRGSPSRVAPGVLKGTGPPWLEAAWGLLPPQAERETTGDPCHGMGRGIGTH